MDAVPGAWTELGGEAVKLFAPRVVPRPEGGEAAEPGAVVGAPLVVATGAGGAVSFGEIQPPGKRRMSTEAWARGR
jgi:methionyl-tRNA formyltransferase